MNMKKGVLILLAALCQGCTAHTGLAGEGSPFAALVSGQFTRVSLCAYGHWDPSMGPVLPETLGSICTEGRNSFVVEVSGEAVADFERTIKDALLTARSVPGEKDADLRCFALMTVSLQSGESVQIFLMGDGELRAGGSSVMPLNPDWADKVIGRFCEMLGCCLSPAVGKGD